MNLLACDVCNKPICIHSVGDYFDDLDTDHHLISNEEEFGEEDNK